MDFDLRWVAGLLFRNGEIEETGVSAGVLNHPANGIAWLVDRLAPHGVAMERGMWCSPASSSALWMPAGATPSTPITGRSAPSPAISREARHGERTSIYVDAFGHANPIPVACRVGNILTYGHVYGSIPPRER